MPTYGTNEIRTFLKKNSFKYYLFRLENDPKGGADHFLWARRFEFGMSCTGEAKPYFLLGTINNLSDSKGRIFGLL